MRLETIISFASIVLVVTVLASPSAAGKYNRKLTPGEKAPHIPPLPATDGKQYGSDDFASAKVLVVVFTCNSCPYAVDYEDRLNAFQKKYCEPPKPDQPAEVRLIAVNANLIAADSLEQMKARATDKEFGFPYLFDESQTLPEAFGAVRTPECFVLDGERRVIYMGAFDDHDNPSNVKHHYVEDAVNASLNKQSVAIAETAPVGCMIRFKRRR